MNEPLVIIPGLMADARLFLPQMVRLGSERACHVCIAAKGETVEQMSEALMAGLPEKFALMGHGLGGDVALDIIRRLPDRVTRVVLLATDPLSEPPAQAAERETRMVMARAGRLVEAMVQELPPAAVADSPWRAARISKRPCARCGCPRWCWPGGRTRWCRCAGKSSRRR